MRTAPKLFGLFAVSFAPALALAGPLPQLGEGTAGVTITVKDNYGVIPGASVRVTNNETKATSRLVADPNGTTAFSGLRAGTYSVRASLPGFADTEQTVSLAAGEQKALELVLTLAQFSTSIIVTTANRREQLLLDVAEPTTLIDEGQILDTGSRTAKDLLVQQAGTGVQVNAGGGQGHISLNGIPNSGVLVLIDGRRFLGRDANGSLNMEELALAGIERVEVVRGPSSALYGADALGGVVNFISKRAKDEGWRNSLSALGGSYGDVRINDSVSVRRGKGGFSGYGAYRSYDGYDLDGDRGPQTIGQPESTFFNGGMSGDLQLGSRVTARLFADYNDRDIDKYYFSGATQLATTVYNSQRTLTRYMISPELAIVPRPDLSFNVSYNYGKYVRDETQTFVIGGRVVTIAPWREWNNELKATGRFEWKAFGRQHPLQAGFERRDEKLRRATLSVADPSRDINVFWMQQQLDLGSRVKLTGGFRNDDYSDFGNAFSPKGGVLVSLARGHRLRATIGEGFRAPYFGELYLNTPPSFVGNPDLKPMEVAPGWTGGYAYSGSKAQFFADWFENKVKNGITFDLTRVPFTYGNLSRYTSSGINTSGSVNLPYGFAPSVSYTYNKRENPQGQEIGGYPKHTGYATLLWTNPRLGWRANLRAEFNGDVPPGVTDIRYQPSYQVWSAQANKRFRLKGAHALSVWAQVTNIFDRKDIYARRACPATGAPVNCVPDVPLSAELLQVWIAPRTFQGGVTIDMDWTK